MKKNEVNPILYDVLCSPFHGSGQWAWVDTSNGLELMESLPLQHNPGLDTADSGCFCQVGSGQVWL